MTLQSTQQNGIVIDDNVKMIIPFELKLICQCKGGFWWAKEESSNSKKPETKKAWDPSKLLLHEGGKELKPVRTIVKIGCEEKTYIPKTIEVNENDKVIIISPIERT